MESRNDRFRRLAISRGDRLIREISLLGNLANRKNYDYNDDEVEQLFRPIEAALAEAKSKFASPTGTSRRVTFDE